MGSSGENTSHDRLARIENEMEEYTEVLKSVLLAVGQAFIIVMACRIFFRGRKTKNSHDMK